MTLTELEQLLVEQAVDFEIIHHPKPIKSRFDALCYFKLEEMAPTLIVKTEKGFYALIVSGAREKVDFEFLRGLLACDEMIMATKEEVQGQIGMKPGEVAMVGHHLPCILDEQLFQQPYIYGGAGDTRCTLKIRPADLEKINKVVGRFN